MSLLKRIEQGKSSQPQTGQPSAGGAQPNLMTLQARRVVPPGVGTQKDTYTDLKTRVQNRLLSELDPSMDITRVGEVRSTIQEMFEQVLAEENIVLSRPERQRLFEQISAEILGYGPIQSLLRMIRLLKSWLMVPRIYILNVQVKLSECQWHSKAMSMSCES